jgi:hypothetical protein
MTARPSALNPTTRRSIEDEIDRLIALLDAMDGDPDLEGDEREIDPAEIDSPDFIWGGGESGGPAHSGC